MKLVLIIGIITTLNLGTLSAMAAPADQALMTEEEQQLKIKAKKRLYPGGKDEEPLKVQPQLPTVTRKMAPATDAPIEETAPDDSSND